MAAPLPAAAAAVPSGQFQTMGIQFDGTAGEYLAELRLKAAFTDILVLVHAFQVSPAQMIKGRRHRVDPLTGAVTREYRVALPFKPAQLETVTKCKAVFGTATVPGVTVECVMRGVDEMLAVFTVLA